MRRGLGFRFWFYFRHGWKTYFAFIFGSINMLTVTYYLAVDNIPALKGAFPSFYIYVATFAAVGVPLLVLMGYVHFKKSLAHRAEVDIKFETDPYLRRIMQSLEYSLPLNVQLVGLLQKLTDGERLSDEEAERLRKIRAEVEDHMSRPSGLKSGAH